MSALITKAKQALGECFIMGFEGTELSDETSAFLSQASIGGVIIFAKNYTSPHQVAELCEQIQDCRRDLPLWISVDHEGGRVQRFQEGFTLIPEARDIAEKDSPKLIYSISEMVALELRSVGINVNFTPVADVDSNPANPIIGRRAFGSDEETVSKMVSSWVRGHVTNGVQACVKHFPGHGDTTVDSHLALARVDTDLETLRDREFKPFLKAFKAGCRWVMTAHVLNPHLDEKVPATLSRHTLIDILRKELRYTGVIVSDDLEMQAITDHYGAEEAPRLAIEAGCDLLIYRSEPAARHAYTALIRALDDGKLSPERVIDAAERSYALKNEFLVPYQKPNREQIDSFVGRAENRELVRL